MTKKLTTKILAMFLCLGLLLSACNNGDGGNNDNEDKTTTEDSGVVTIGALAPLTGNVAIYGNMATNGAKLAVEEINAAGGIDGKQIEYLVEDEQGDATEAVTAYNKLFDKGIDFLFGDITSGPTEAVAELANQDGVPMMTPTGTQDGITVDRDYIFRVCYTDSYQGNILAQYAIEELGAKTAAIMTNNSSDYSDGVAQTFKAKAEELGLEVVAEESYGNSDTDFKAQLTNIANVNPDVVVIPDYYEVIAMIAPQAKDTGIDATLIGPDGWDGVLAQLNESEYDNVEGAVFTNHYSVEDDSEKVQNFLAAYKEKYDEEPASFSALAYDGIYLYKEAVEKAGTTDHDAVKDALKEIEFDGVTGKLKFDENNNPIKDVSMIKIENGKYTLETVVSPQ
ncbi:MAG: ABC transporter substrate-binding protein [Tissierellia bacterium]|nr:ABC transporter substrate-binding protein [Tissierellia bacterium]